MCWNFFYKRMNALSDAIDLDDEAYFTKIMKATPDVNKPFTASITPLEYCLVRQRFNLAFKLLEEFKANPNVSSKGIHHISPTSLLRITLEGNNICAAKLLILYGAKIEETTFLPHPNPEAVSRILNINDTKTILIEFQKNYYDKIFKAASNPAELARLWLEVSNQEKNLQLRECYAQKARSYSQSLSIATTATNSQQCTPVASINSFIDDIKMPLLAQKISRTNTF